jgi:hypothetical protein
MDLLDRLRLDVPIAQAGMVGGLFHWVTKTEGGIRVTDVWHSAEQFQAFADEQIGPITAAVGIAEPPVVTMHAVHNYLTAGGN